APPDIYSLSLHDALPIWTCSFISSPFHHRSRRRAALIKRPPCEATSCSAERPSATVATSNRRGPIRDGTCIRRPRSVSTRSRPRSEEHTSELQSLAYLVC